MTRPGGSLFSRRWLQRLSALSLLLLFVMPDKARAEEPVTFKPDISVEDVRPTIAYLASPELAGRGGRHSAQAADFVVRRFQELGLQPLFAEQSYYQDIPAAKDENGVRRVLGRNVGAFLPGSDPARCNEILIISAHYDHLGTRGGEIFAGADDNASGVAMMLSVATALSKQSNKPARGIAFVGFDLEEHMLWGSTWFAAHPPWPIERVKLFITADMIGRSLGDLPLSAVFVLGSEHAPELKQTLDRVGCPEGLDVARLCIDLIGTRSDYGPFRDRQIPFLFFSSGEHPDYHTPRDTPDRIDYEKVARVSSLVLRLVRDVSETEELPGWVDKPEIDLDEPRALERITTLLLEAGDKRPLTDVQRYMVSLVRKRSRAILEKGEMTPDDRTWLVRMSQLLLLSVF